MRYRNSGFPVGVTSVLLIGFSCLQVRTDLALIQFSAKDLFRLLFHFILYMLPQDMCEIRTPIVNVRFGFTIRSKAFVHLRCNTSRLPEVGHNVGQSASEIGNANLLLNMRVLLGMENRRCLINIYRCGLPSDALGCGRSRVGRFNCRPIYMRQDMRLIIESYRVLQYRRGGYYGEL